MSKRGHERGQMFVGPEKGEGRLKREDAGRRDHMCDTSWVTELHYGAVKVVNMALNECECLM